MVPRPSSNGHFRPPRMLALFVLCLGVGLCVGTAHAADTESPASAATQQMRAAIQAGRAVLPENLHVEVQAKRQSSSSGSCVPFRGSPATSGKCDHVVTYPNIYLKPYQSYEALDEATASLTDLVGAFIPHDCRQALLKFLCLGNFLECSVDTTTFEASVQLPCRSTCEQVLLECTAFAIESEVTYLLPNCDMIVNVSGRPTPAYPPDGVAPCSAAEDDVYVPYSQADCPYPLMYNQDGESNFAATDYDGGYICLYPCPEDKSTFTSSQWNVMLAAVVILNFLSFWLSLFLVVSFLLIPQKRRFPALIFLYLSAIATVVGFVCLFFPAVRGGIEPLICTEGNPPLYVDMDNAGDHNGGGVPCIIQGMFTYYCPLAAMLWWVLLTVAVFELVVLEHSTTFIKKVHYWYHFVAWGLPFIGLIIMLATKQIASVGAPVCFFKTANHDEYHWPLFYGPLSLGLLIGTILMTAAIIKFVRVRFRFKGQTRNKIEQLIRMILLVVAFWLILLYPLIFRIYQQATENELRTAVNEQVECSARSGTECDASKKINYGAALLQLMDVSAYGIVMWMCMCSSDIIVWWWNLGKVWVTTPPREALQITRDMIMMDRREESKGSTFSAASRSKNSASRSTEASIQEDIDDGDGL